MTGKTMRAAPVLTEEQRTMLKKLAGSRTAAVREVERAKVLLGCADGASISDVMRRVGVGRPIINKCIDKALAAGVSAGLRDTCHRPHEPEISDAAKAWVVSIACTKPKDHDLAAELWSISALARFVSERAVAADHPRLAQAGKSTVWRILNEHDIKPHKIRCYLEKRHPDFDRKMQEVYVCVLTERTTSCTLLNTFHFPPISRLLESFSIYAAFGTRSSIGICGLPGVFLRMPNLHSAILVASRKFGSAPVALG